MVSWMLIWNQKPRSFRPENLFGPTDLHTPSQEAVRLKLACFCIITTAFKSMDIFWFGSTVVNRKILVIIENGLGYQCGTWWEMPIYESNYNTSANHCMFTLGSETDTLDSSEDLGWPSHTKVSRFSTEARGIHLASQAVIFLLWLLSDGLYKIMLTVDCDPSGTEV